MQTNASNCDIIYDGDGDHPWYTLYTTSKAIAAVLQKDAVAQGHVVRDI